MFKQVIACDWVGAAIVLAWATCLILGLEYGGITKSWKSADVIVLLVMIPVLAVVFFLWEFYLGKKAMLPLSMLKDRSVT